MSFFTFIIGAAIVALLLTFLFMFCFGLMHGHMRNKGESFGAQVNNDLDRRLRQIERKLDAALSSDD